MPIVVENGITVGNGITIGGGAPAPTPTLILELDAMDYSGSGSTWTAAVGTNATLFGNPTYNASSPEWFSFNPLVFQYATSTAGSLNTWSIEAWFNTNSSLTGQITSVVTDQFDLTSSLNFSMGTNNAPLDYDLNIGFFDGSGWHRTSGFTPTQGTWYHVVGTYDGNIIKQYVNNSLNSQHSYTGTSQSTTLTTRIARRWDSPSNSSINYFPGLISIVRVYQNAMSAADVTASWNADKARFGY